MSLQPINPPPNLAPNPTLSNSTPKNSIQHSTSLSTIVSEAHSNSEAEEQEEALLKKSKSLFDDSDSESDLTEGEDQLESETETVASNSTANTSIATPARIEPPRAVLAPAAPVPTNTAPRYTVTRVSNSTESKPNIITLNLDCSDGYTWPDSVIVKARGTWMSQSSYNTAVKKSGTKWRWEIGTYLAQELGIAEATGKGKKKQEFYILDKFPQDYQFTVEARSSGNHVDAYLFGANHRFRSPREFFGHIKWLITSRGVPGAPKCICKYCGKDKSQHAINQKLGLAQLGFHSVKRPPPTASTSKSGLILETKRVRKPTQTSTRPPSKRAKGAPKAAAPLPTYDGIFADAFRDKNLGGGAIYREGELIWVELEKPILDSTQGIKYWPGLLSGSKLVPSSANVGAKDIPVLQTSQTFAYSVQLLGCEDVVTSSEDHIKAWLSLDPREIAPAITGTETIQFDGDEIKLLKMEEFKSIQQAAEYLGFALEMAASISASFSLLDRYHIAPAHIHSKKNLSVVQMQELNQQAQFWHYQSLWFGPELIWSGELVRLLETGELPEGIEARSVGAEGRSLFLRIDGIYEDEKMVPMLSGQLYELEKEAMDEDELVEPVLYMPTPPPGFQFRLLNQEKTSISVELEFLAGRYYAKSLTPVARNVEKVLAEVTNLGPGAQKNLDLLEARALSLFGLLPAYTLYSSAVNWNSSRHEAVQTAEKSAREAIVSFSKNLDSQSG